MSTATVAVIMVFAIPLAAVIGGLAVEALKTLKEGRDKDLNRRLQEETELVQQMRRQMDAMQDRVEALETLLIERDRERPYADLHNELSETPAMEAEQ